MDRFHLTRKSSNWKTGAIPVSTSPKSTCPSNCKLREKGCYAEGGPLAIHWSKVSNGERGTTWDTFIKDVSMLPPEQLWRHNQAGDLRGSKNRINRTALKMLVEAQNGKRGYTYSHFPVEGDTGQSEHNRELIKWANQEGFTINLSADNVDQADKMVDLNIGPVTVTLPSNVGNKPFKTPKGNRVVICPAITKDTTCEKCGICAESKRKFIVGFPAHGARKGMIK